MVSAPDASGKSASAVGSERNRSSGSPITLHRERLDDRRGVDDLQRHDAAPAGRHVEPLDRAADSHGREPAGMGTAVPTTEVTCGASRLPVVGVGRDGHQERERRLEGAAEPAPDVPRADLLVVRERELHRRLQDRRHVLGRQDLVREQPRERVAEQQVLVAGRARPRADQVRQLDHGQSMAALDAARGVRPHPGTAVRLAAARDAVEEEVHGEPVDLGRPRGVGRVERDVALLDRQRERAAQQLLQPVLDRGDQHAHCLLKRSRAS